MFFQSYPLRGWTGLEACSPYAPVQVRWDPREVTVPVLIIRGEWDAIAPAYAAQDILAGLTSAPVKRSVTVSAGTHLVMMERNRMQFFREVQTFLEEPR
jgi:pimeloyl-ACP methyl ester carboxylesterase